MGKKVILIEIQLEDPNAMARQNTTKIPHKTRTGNTSKNFFFVNDKKKAL
jgi:hypothetical protein